MFFISTFVDTLVGIIEGTLVGTLVGTLFYGTLVGTEQIVSNGNVGKYEPGLEPDGPDCSERKWPDCSDVKIRV